MAQVRKRCWSHAHVVLHLTFSFLMFHPSLLLSFLLFLDGHFETTPDYDLTDFDVHDFLPNFSDLKAQVKRTPHEDELCGYLAKSALNTGHEPNKFDKNTSVDEDAMPINDPDHNFSDFSKATNENTSQFGVHTHCLNPLFLHVSQRWFCSSDRKQRKHPIGKMLRDREKQRKEKVSRPVLQSWCRWKVDRTVVGVIRFRLTKYSFLMNEISEGTWNEELNGLFLVKIQFRENYTRLSTTWRSKNWNKFRIRIIWLTAWARISRLQSLEDIQWTDKFNVKEYICVANWGWKNRLHQECYTRSCREIQELKRRCCQEENGVIQQKLN